jgi:hypothetical protein
VFRRTLALGGSADLFAREIYMLTDLSRTAWQEPDESGLSDLLKQHDWLQVYIVDVSVPAPVNAAISGSETLQRHHDLRT